MNELTVEKLYNIGKELSDFANINRLTDVSLIIKLDKDFVHKIDEDLFYRLKEVNSNEEYIPTDNEINLYFDNVKLNIISK